MEQHCKDCIHFVQHYYRGKESYRPVHCGHCIQGRRSKSRPPDTSVCQHFVQGKRAIR